MYFRFIQKTIKPLVRAVGTFPDIKSTIRLTDENKQNQEGEKGNTLMTDPHPSTWEQMNFAMFSEDQWIWVILD